MASPLLPIETHDAPGASEAKSAALLKELARKSPQAGITAASHLEIRPSPEMASSGIQQIDALTGGLPRGCLTEVSGAESSGRTSLLLAALAAATRREEICALIDVSDAFDPHSAVATGLDLDRLLWVRCGAHAQASAWSRRRRQPASLQEWERRRMEDPVEQALRATDLLLQSSGFGMVGIDLAGVPPKMARRIPLTTWFRFRRAVENTPAILLVMGAEFYTQSCASLAVELSRQKTSRQSSVVSRQQAVFSSQLSVVREEISLRSNEECVPHGREAENPSHAELFIGMESRAELLHTRTDRKPVQSANAFTTRTAWSA
jgi:recA bacterial DNA recombination protein